MLAASHVPSFAQENTAKPGGRFRVAIGQAHTSDNLDPSRVATNFQINIQYALRNYLVEVNSRNELVGELAESWEPSADGKLWSFRIRKGVEFHNGKPLTPQDVAASIEFHRSEQSTSGAKALLKPIDRIAADGDRVNFHLAETIADFAYYLFHFQLSILPADGDGKVDWESGVGTGGYVLQAFQPGINLRAKKNPNYWKANAAHFDEIELIAMPDVSARTNALTSGEIDAMDECDPRTASLFKKTDGVVLEEVPGIETQLLPMDMTVAPFNNNDVRLALKYAMDREAYIKLILRGYGTMGNDTPIAPFMPFHAELPQRTYDPEKAKFHLKKAGLGSLKVPLHAADIFPRATDAALVYKEFAAKAGIEIDVVRESADDFWSNVWLVKPFVVSNWTARAVPDMILTEAYKCGAAWNETKMCNEKFDRLLAEARSTMDNPKRVELYREIQEILRDEGGSIVPAFNSLLFARSAKVRRGDGLTSNYALDGYRATERWWFA
ncbi:MAG: ABC transporter substrate-binding protein [Parvibaculaceae bacterium]